MNTFCTRLCENETNLKVIQTVMGHKDIQTTMDIYADCTEEKKQEVLDGKIEIPTALGDADQNEVQALIDSVAP